MKIMSMRLQTTIRFFLIFYAYVISCSQAWSQTFPSWGIIHNSLDKKYQTIALGVNPQGNLNTPVGTGTDANNAKTLNSNLPSKPGSPGTATGAVGIAYNWLGYTKQNKYDPKATYLPGWYDGTSPGIMWEGWGVSAVDDRMMKVSGYASLGSQANLQSPVLPNVTNVTVKSFVVDDTSIKSTVWINDSSGLPMLEVTHLYGPTSGKTNQTLFQSLVTITNISGGTLGDVRYKRTMDWDILNNTGSINSDHTGVENSKKSENLPRVLTACDNGGSDNGFGGMPSPSNSNGSTTKPAQPPDPLDICRPVNGSSLDKDFIGLGPDNKGASFTFEFGELYCNESATFYIYYGAAGTSPVENFPYKGVNAREALKDSFISVGASIYSIGYDKNYDDIAYGFGFKGVSGSAVAPVLPTKVASLPGGSSTDPSVYHTYTPPVIGEGRIYQALFRYQKDKQWIGEIKRYDLDSLGMLLTDNVVLASAGLKKRAAVNADYAGGGRTIWTVGYDPRCMATTISSVENDRLVNNFNLSNATLLEKLLFNCPATSNIAATTDLINFTRGLNAYKEEDIPEETVRSSVLGDTYHSEMVMVGPPNAHWTTDLKFAKSEAFFRGNNDYEQFITTNGARRKQLYVGANDGMLHAFDEDLNERWAFIPPSVIPILRNMAGDKGAGKIGGGKSNSIFTVDGPIVVKDVYIKDVYTKAYGWKTVLIGGLGWGGNSYYALDITDPDKPNHLFTINNDVANKVINYWDASGKKSTFAYNSTCKAFDYSKIGGAWSRPVIMLLPYAGGQRWVALFGGGYAGGASVTGTGSTSSFGAYAFAIELGPDSSLSTEGCGASVATAVTSTGGHVLTNPNLKSDNPSNIPNGVTANLTVVTADGTSLADYYGGIAYFTDLQGQLWKWDLSSPSDTKSPSFGLELSFNAEATLANDRMGYNQLATTIASDKKTLFNYFGTGDVTRIQRRASSINNRIYGIADSKFPLGAVSVQSANELNPDNCQADKSWYANVWAVTGVDKNSDYQKVVGRASVFNKYVYFSAYQPDDKACPIYGRSRLIEMTDTCKAGGAGAVIGEGLATQPVIDNRGNIYIGVGNLPPGQTLENGVDNIAKFTATSAKSTKRVQYKSWREKRN